MKRRSNLNVLHVSIGIMLVSMKIGLIESKNAQRKMQESARSLNGEFGAWGSYGSPGSVSMFGYGNSVGPNTINVLQVDGKTQIALNGVRIDLSRASVVLEDPYKVVLSPVEAPDAMITLSKMDNGKIAIDYRGQHYESLRPQDIDNMINANMAQMNNQMQKLQQQIQNMEKNMFDQFKSFPDMGGMMNSFFG